MTDQTLKALIYCRISSKSQEELGSGLDSQETRCRRHAANKGYDVVMVFPDTITGGGDYMKRPGMLAMLSFIDAQPDENFVVIFDDLKRASRDTRAFLNLRDGFRLRRVQVECLNFDLGETPESEFAETIVVAQGALERKQNGRMVAQRMEARMHSGYWVHDAPIGYEYRTVKGRGKILFPAEPLAAIIREGFEHYASGHLQTQAEVKRFFESFPDFPRNKQGEVKQQKVTRILTQPLYAGYVCSENYSIHWLKGQHEPLITLETFERVQERRAGTAKAPKRKNIGEHFALRGFVCCDGCGVPLRSSLARGKMGKRYPYYLCQTKTCDSYGKSIPRDRLENEIGAFVKSLQPSKTLFQLAASMVKHLWDHQRQQAAEIARSSKLQMSELEKQIDQILDRMMDVTNRDVIARFESKIAGLEKRKSILAEQSTKTTAPAQTFEEKLEPVLTFLANPWKLWQTEGKSRIYMRRLVLKLAFTNRIKYCRIEGPRTPEIALPFKALREFSDLKFSSGAGGGTRTPTGLRPTDFKSGVSTIPPRPQCAHHTMHQRSVNISNALVNPTFFAPLCYDQTPSDSTTSFTASIAT
jgi:site-specific DNA recombinase